MESFDGFCTAGGVQCGELGLFCRSREFRTSQKTAQDKGPRNPKDKEGIFLSDTLRGEAIAWLFPVTLV